MPVQSQSHKVQNPSGFHARPVRVFAETAAAFPCSVFVRKGDKRVNGKSVLAMLTLRAKHLDTLTIEAEGDRAAEALESLAQIVRSTFTE